MIEPIPFAGLIDIGEDVKEILTEEEIKNEKDTQPQS